MPRLSVFAVLGGFAAALVFAAFLCIAPAARAGTPSPATPRGLPAAIEPLAPYVEQAACDPVPRAGTLALAHLLTRTYRGTTFATTYACGTDGTRSEHYDGRAIDWMVSIADPAQHADALAVLRWLLATDAAGNRFAMARRLGVMYVIYDNRMWGAWDGRWEPYNGCARLKSHAYDNSCHRTHMHISLSWNGAMGRTSFWTKGTARTDYGPCRPRDLNWAPRYRVANPRPCPAFPAVTASRGASALRAALVRFSGAAIRRGWTGPSVLAVQQALHVRQSGVYDHRTAAAVRAFQLRRLALPTGIVTASTWRLLLAAVR